MNNDTPTTSDADRFDSLGLDAALLQTLAKRNIVTPTAIQKQAIPLILAGRNVIACSETGSGKTLAYLLPILPPSPPPLKQSLHGTHSLTPPLPPPPLPHPTHPATTDGLPNVPRIILVPTRELAGQIAQQVEIYSRNLPVRWAVIHGGEPIAGQIRKVAQGLDLLIATPGRLLDLMSQSRLGIKYLKLLVLDEADRLLDPTFRTETMRLIDKRPADCQTLVFSASLPLDTVTLLHSKISDPASLVIQSRIAPVDRLQATLYRVPHAKDKPLLLAHWLTKHPQASVLVFVGQPHQADRLVTFLYRHNVAAQSLHGQMKPTQRQVAIDRFGSQQVRVLVATDLAARGMDWPFVTHVIQMELPDDPTTFMHRAGRTARQQTSDQLGHVLCIVAPQDEARAAQLQRLLGQELIQGTDHPIYPSRTPLSPPPHSPSSPSSRSSRSSRYSKRSTESDKPKPTTLYQRRGKQKKG